MRTRWNCADARCLGIVLGLVIGVTLLPRHALAVDPRVYQLEGGGAIAPHLTVEFGQDSNPFRSERGSEPSSFLRIEPEVTYIVQRRNNKLSFGYQGNYLQYLRQYCSDPVTAGFFSVNRPGDCLSDASPEFDKASFQNHSVEVLGFLEINRRARANVSLGLELVNQPLGTGLSSVESVATSLERPDSFVRNSALLGFSYGAVQARGELRFNLNIVDRDFRENAGRNLDGLDERRVDPSAQILYRIGSRTQIFAGLGQGDISGGNSERTISKQFVGVEFGATAITSGTIRVSAVTEDFDDPNRNDISFGGFDIDLTWKPRRFSTVTIGGGRGTERATISEAVGLTTRLDVTWRHSWRDRFSTSLSVDVERNDTDDEIASNDANDRTTSIRLVGNYNIRRWLDIGAFAQTQSREGSSVNGDSRDFSRRLIGLTANGTF